MYNQLIAGAMYKYIYIIPLKLSIPFININPSFFHPLRASHWAGHGGLGALGLALCARLAAGARPRARTGGSLAGVQPVVREEVED